MTDEETTLTAGEILKATGGGLLRGHADWACRGLSTDTRPLRAGNLFIALAGERFDGHDCLAEALQKGAAGLLIRTDRRQALASVAEGTPVIGVTDTLWALGEIARDWRLRFPVPLVAITGSSGKTTTKEMLAAIVSPSRKLLATEGNLNNLIGLPRTLLGLRQGHEVIIVEMGTSTPGEIPRLAAIARPDIGLITNIGPAHLEGLGSLESVREEKGGLFAAMAGRGTAILNRDDEQIGILARRWRGDAITFGLETSADVAAGRIETAGLGESRFNLIIAGVGVPVRLQAPGRHNVRNALAAAAAAMALGFDRHAIAEGLSRFSPVPGRMEIRPLPNGSFLILDTYNANPASVRAALETLQGLRGAAKAVAVLGDMLELGPDAEKLHAEIGEALVESGVSRVFLKGTLSRSTADGALRKGFGKERIVFFEEPGDVIATLLAHLGKGDWVLVKGSRKMKMEAVAEAIISAFDLKTQTV
jgi:UDP-N-acetylmuramoyl-tripeptide--D-alanyl-D-alanine ligase